MARMTIDQAAAALASGPTFATLANVSQERLAQLEKWGIQNHAPRTWLAILLEEVGEVAKALNDGEHPDALREELIQVAAVAVAIVDDMATSGGRFMDRRR